MALSPLAGTSARSQPLLNVSALIAAYYDRSPDKSHPEQRVAFGTSGHRGSPLAASFNEAHVLAVTQAICLVRAHAGINGPLYLGVDTHAVSRPAFESALEVLSANEVLVRIAPNDEYTPTPAVSHAILAYNRGRQNGFADGIIITPSHNPPEDGGFKYNPPNGGPADTAVTREIETLANGFLAHRLADVRRIPLKKARSAWTTSAFDFLTAYVTDLGSVIDMDKIRSAGIRMGADPLGGAGVHYWRRIADEYKLDLTVVSEEVDPAFGFMSLDWDGRIRMDPSSSYAMRRLIDLKDRFDVAFGCDTDHDRHGIVTPGKGLLASNHYLATMVDYLFTHRPHGPSWAAVGKTVVSTSMIDRVTTRLGRSLYEVPVGFKWFVEGLATGTLGCVGEESAGATFLRRDGGVWTTEKDGLIPGLLAAEMTASRGRDPGQLYDDLEKAFGVLDNSRVDAPATPVQKALLAKITPEQLTSGELAGEKILAKMSTAPGNGAAIGGVKVVTSSGWFAARPSGTENIYKIYAESSRGAEHLRRLLEEAQTIVDAAIAPKKS
ncbi:MAG TPA: phosphoglucomutase (alpha-D-glucose-1,6-bisphosphate-dependent) [Vicinamibacterales bacterium]|nr:phosphoglucomutase (alpha-D-glucose-1,6-bisphosphate-dependent) [Vicinamibacterales bacterium]